MRPAAVGDHIRQQLAMDDSAVDIVAQLPGVPARSEGSHPCTTPRHSHAQLRRR